jgi:hypothetical protein
VAIRRQIRSRLHVPLRKPSAAMVVAILALILSVAGNAAAAIIISSNAQVAAHTIAGAAAKKSDHQNLIPGSVGAPDLANAAITAAKLASDARSHKVDVKITGSGGQTILHLDELTLSAQCDSTGGTTELSVNAKTSVAAEMSKSLTFSAGTTSASDYALTANDLTGVVDLNSSSEAHQGVGSQLIYRNAKRVITLSLYGVADSSNGGLCSVTGTALAAAAE